MMKHLIYARKSTESEDRQVLSIPAQLNELHAIAEREGYEIEKVYEESMSAKASGRPVLNEMIQHIQKGRYSLLVWNVDRLARNMVDGGMILELMDQGKIVEIRTYEKTYRNTPDDKFMMSLSFGIAKKYVDDLSVNVKRGLVEKLKRGEWPNKAPFGYLNDSATKGIVIDPERARYVRRTYELYLTGTHSFASIADQLYAEGLRTASGKKVLKSYIQRILNTRFYTGVMEREGKLYEGNYEALVSKDMYDKAQQIMHGTSRPRSKSNAILFPLRGFLFCDNCGCTLTSTLKKGHQYYYCTNGRGGCDAHKTYLREYNLYNQLGEVLSSLHFSERKIALMYKAAQARVGHDTSEARLGLESLERRLNDLPGRESRLLDAYVAGQITQELYDQKSAALKHERIDIQKQIEALKSADPSFTLEPTKKIFEQGNTASKDFIEGSNEKKRKVLENLLWNLTIKDGKVAQVQYKTPFHVLANAHKRGSISTMLRD